MAKRTSVIEQSGPLAAMMEQLASSPVAALKPPPGDESLPKESPAAVLIEVPLGPGDVAPRTFGAHIDIRLTPEQSTILYGLANRLDTQQARLKSDVRVTSIHGALRWLLESIAKEIR
jgi:hypothetical protein